MTLDGEWSYYGIGDPYVLKHNGVYYLYCSTKDWETGVKTWSSKDLMNWSYEGLCSTDPISESAFAPEVYYWNGMFYMYTSPAGRGHYALSSDSPTGPFTVASPMLYKWIDGAVYIDDDANWYFYHAHVNGIQGCEMPSPIEVGTSVNLNAQMNSSWTEGPCLFKRNGVYYMIYTGNHLRTTGYRIDYGTNTTGPLEPFTPASLQNPILLNTMGDHVGLGHGSIFLGPDLDSYYLTYHSMIDRGPRQLNFDRIAWNGEKMILLGSTDFEQQRAALPDAYDYFERESPGEGWSFTGGGQWSIQNSEFLLQDAPFSGVETWYKALLDSTTQDNFTAEFNLREINRENDEARAGAIFSYVDEGTFGIALIHGFTKKLEINFLKDNVWEAPQYYELPADFDLSAWHTIRIEKYNGQFRFFVDGLLKGSLVNEAGAGKTGYLASRNHVAFGFIGFSNMVNGSGVFDIHKPLPGEIDAVLYNQGGEGVGYHDETPPAEPGNIIRSDETEIIECSRGGYAIHSVKAGDWYRYNVNVKRDGNYNCEVVYASASSSNSITISVGETDVSGVVELPSTGGTDQWRSFVIKNLQLPTGTHTLKVEAVSGDFDFYSFRFVEADNDAHDKTFDFEYSFGKGWEYRDGDWSIQNQEAVVNGYGKRTYGSAAWRDYTVETDMVFTRGRNAGLMFRVNNPAPGGAANDPENDPEWGTSFFQGYSVRFSPSNVLLFKHNYDSKLITLGPGSFPMDSWFHLRVVVVYDSIKVYVDDMVNPVINYRDTIPFINGMAGFHSVGTDVRFDNFRVTSKLLTTSDRKNREEVAHELMHVYPNPSSGSTMIEFGSATRRKIRIADTRGVTLISYNTSKERVVLPANTIPPGFYIVIAEDKTGIHTKKLYIK
ncbi:MAG: family 43 glycosylhydrolase [Bacteroidota bacterium]